LPDKNHINELHNIFAGLSKKEFYSKNKKNVLVEQSCYIPLSHDNLPLIGKISGTNNAYIGAGHTDRGILNGPITGKLLAELIIEGKVSSIKQKEFDHFDPSR